MAAKLSEGTAGSQSELARQLGVSRGAVRGWISHKLWCFGPRAPWPTAAVKEWRARVIPWHRSTVGGGVGRDTKEQRDKVALERARLALDEMKGLLVSSDAVGSMAFDMGRWLKTEVTELCRRLPGQLAGKEPAELRADLDREQRRLLAALEAKVSAVATK